MKASALRIVTLRDVNIGLKYQKPAPDVELSDTWTEDAALEAAVDDTAEDPNDAVSPSVDVVGAGSSEGAFSED